MFGSPFPRASMPSQIARNTPPLAVVRNRANGQQNPVQPSARDQVANRLGLSADASNAEILATLDTKVTAARAAKAARAAQSADDALYDAAWGTPTETPPDSPLAELVARAGWGES